MIRQQDADHDNQPFSMEILANLSISLDRLVAVFLALSTVTVLVAVPPAALGYWPILVVAIAHVLVVGWCLRLAWRRHWTRERVQIGPESTIIEQFSLDGQRSVEWPTAWLRVCLVEDRREQRLFLDHQGNRLELARKLPEAERRDAAHRLAAGLRRYSAWREDPARESMNQRIAE